MELLEMAPEAFLTKIASLHNFNQIDFTEMWKRLDQYVAQSTYGRAMRSLLDRADWYQQRRDGKMGRTPEVFSNDIKRQSHKEHALMEIWRADLMSRGHVCEYEDMGVDNSGQFVRSSKDMSKPDFLVTIDDTTDPHDMKNGPVIYKATFKTGELKRAIEHDANIILFIGTGFLDKKPPATWEPNSDWFWAVLGKDAIRSLLTLKHRYYPEFGGKKEAVMIGPGRTKSGDRRISFHELFKVYTLGEKVRYEGPSNNFIDFQGQ